MKLEGSKTWNQLFRMHSESMTSSHSRLFNSTWCKNFIKYSEIICLLLLDWKGRQKYQKLAKGSVKQFVLYDGIKTILAKNWWKLMTQSFKYDSNKHLQCRLYMQKIAFIMVSKKVSQPLKFLKILLHTTIQRISRLKNNVLWG